MSELSKFQEEVREWAEGTFNPNDQFTKHEFIKGRINHFLKEARELKEEFIRHPFPALMKSMGGELADCFILLLHISDLLRFDLLEEAYEKMEVNKRRAWDQPDEDGVIEHIEEGEDGKITR
jgi:NTP pyrophosphatase (non-canonical NTP hydrolase)